MSQQVLDDQFCQKSEFLNFLHFLSIKIRQIEVRSGLLSLNVNNLSQIFSLFLKFWNFVLNSCPKLVGTPGTMGLNRFDKQQKYSNFFFLKYRLGIIVLLLMMIAFGLFRKEHSFFCFQLVFHQVCDARIFAQLLRFQDWWPLGKSWSKNLHELPKRQYCHCRTFDLFLPLDPISFCAIYRRHRVPFQLLSRQVCNKLDKMSILWMNEEKYVSHTVRNLHFLSKN